MFMFVYIQTVAARNKTLKTTSHDQDKEKLSSPPGIRDYTCACAYACKTVLYFYSNDRQPDKPVTNVPA